MPRDHSVIPPAPKPMLIDIWSLILLLILPLTFPFGRLDFDRPEDAKNVRFLTRHGSSSTDISVSLRRAIGGARLP
jgi:hypothetical protein